MFGRRKRSEDPVNDATGEQDAGGAPVGEVPVSPAVAGDGDTPVANAPTGWRVEGPWDLSEVADASDGGRRLDLGGMWLAGRPGIELQVQVDQESGSLEGITFVDGQSGLEVRPFAAPRAASIWDEVREELTNSLREQGAATEEVDGPFGVELRAAIPAQLPDGQPGFQPLRFLGIDGPRWFLRGVVSGRGALEPGAGAVLEEILRDVVVVRGKEPMAPRDPLPLRLPPQAAPAAAQPAEGDADAESGTDAGADAGAEAAAEGPGKGQDASGLRMPERGPEITETR